MRSLAAALGLLLALPLLVGADEPDYKELSSLMQQAVIRQLPGKVEKQFGWGETIPVPPNLRLPRLRTYVKVGDGLEVPHGAWRRVQGFIEDPQRNLQLHVRDFRQIDATMYRLALDVDAIITCQGEWQQWQKGLLLVGAAADADADVRVSLVCDVGVSLDLKTFPPAVNLDPKVQELNIDLKHLYLHYLGNRLVRGEKIEGVPQRLEEIVRDVLKQGEPLVRDYANNAIARGLREGKGNVSPAALFKAAQGAKTK